MSGWRERWARFLGTLKNVYTLSKVKRGVPDWTLSGFKEHACSLYTDVSCAIAAGDRNALRHVSTDALLSQLKSELRKREAAGWARVSWKLDEVTGCSVVHGRLVQMKDSKVEFAQLTVELLSRQTFAAYDRKGGRVAGDETKPVKVRDVWVFERVMGANVPPAMQKWRVAARLDSVGS